MDIMVTASKKLKIGLIGYSQDNGHPFSFSAIINGYNKNYFYLNPIIPINDYLGKQSADKFGIGNLQITHVWTQKKEISKAIALYSNIPIVVNDYDEMLVDVDGVLILRDDMHLEIAALFLEQGKFVFIDKPLSIQNDELEIFKPYLENGQLMSCSGLRYFPVINELKNSDYDYSSDLKFAYCTTVDNWFNYGIHSIEGLMSLSGSAFDYVQYIGNKQDNQYMVVFKSGFYLIINSASGYNGGIRSHLYFKSHEPIQVHYNDNFNSFRNTLLKFNQQIITGTPAISPIETLNLMKLLMAGDESRRMKGKKIYLNG